MNRRKFATTIGQSILLLQLFPHLLPYFSKSKKDFLMGKSNTSHFKKIGNHFVEKETATQFQLMQKAAKKEGIEILLVSAFRSFSRQKEIFENKFLQLENSNLNQLEVIQQITQYSSIPGTSRHHWGTDLDLIQFKPSVSIHENVLEPKYFEEEGKFSALHVWMQENAASFGFYLSYTKDEQRTGYQYEPWHYSYLPKAKGYLNQFMELNLAEKIQRENIIGLNDLSIDFFEKYISDYVLGVNSVLK